jgi:antitoxin component YwqK of YwqJK toxin-antitoxin module
MKYLLFLFLGWGLSYTPAGLPQNFVEKQDCHYHYDDLRVDFDVQTRRNMYYLDGQPFTGCVRQDSPEGNLYILHYVKEGRLERQLGYYTNGVKCRDYTFKDGFEHGVLELFFPDGSPYIRENYNNGQLHGKLKRWKNGQLVREADFWYGTLISEKLYDVPGEEKQKPPSMGRSGC